MFYSVAVAALVLLLPQASCAGPAVHIPLRRMSDRVRNVTDHFAAGARARARYGYSSKLNERATSSFPLTDQHADASYVGTVSVGTPSQNFEVILDTGSSDFWVVDSACLGCSSGISFDFSSSSTFHQAASAPVQVNYGSGSVAGIVATDTVTMGPFTVSSQGFLLAEQLTSGLLTGNVSGLMGLAFQALANTGAVPFWQALSANNQLSSQEMAFHLTRSSSSSDQPGGTFTLGGTDTSLYTGNIEFQNLVGSQTPTFWLLQVSSLTIQGKSVAISDGSAVAAIDTGTSLIGGPSDTVRAIWAAVPGSSPVPASVGQGYYQFPCSTTVSVTISFGGQAWTINPQDMNIGQLVTGSSLCVGAIFDLTSGAATSPGSPGWVIGDTFLKNVYTVFKQNPPSVGFAHLASDGSSGGNSVSASTSSSHTSSTSQPSPPTSQLPTGTSFSTVASIPTSPVLSSPTSATLPSLPTFTPTRSLPLSVSPSTTTTVFVPPSSSTATAPLNRASKSVVVPGVTLMLLPLVMIARMY